MSLSLGSALGIAGATSLLSGITNFLTGQHNMEKQAEMSRDLWEYQWTKAYSPQAQVRNNAAAGVNPAAQFGNHSTLAGSPQLAMPSMPNTQFGVTGLSDLANYIVASAQEKKTGADVNNVNADTEIKKIQADRERFQNDLLNRFGLQKSAADLALAEEQVRLAKLSGDDKERDIGIKKWTEAKEKAASECNEAQRDILLKELANKDIELDIRNRTGEANIGEIKSRSAANYASADASKASAEKMRSEKEYQDMVNEIKAGSWPSELEAILDEYSSRSSKAAAEVEQFKDMFNRYRTLNENNENGAADYLNHMFWYIKEKMPSLPIVPFLRIGK